MSFTAGDRLGVFEIVGAVGAGGPASAERDLRSQLRRGLAGAQVRIWL